MTAPTFRLDPNPKDMAPSDLVAPEHFTTDDKTELNVSVFETEDESVLSGVWESAPAREAFPDGYPVHEMMHVISGSVTLTHPDGREETFRAGDTFFIPKGAPCTWENKETLRKFYMIAS